MGEYATRISDGERVKIGTCESMYYLRADQRHLVTGGDLGAVPERDYWPHVRFRFPWPDEDSQQPGEFTDGRFERNCALHGVEMPDGVDHGHVQFTAPGYNVCLPCPESWREIHALAPDESSSPVTIHRNGFPGAVLLCEQRLRDGKLMAVLQCGGCGAKWRVETWAEIAPAVVALRSEADRKARAAEVSPHGAGSDDGTVKWLHAVADRVTAGYGSEAVQG